MWKFRAGKLIKRECYFDNRTWAEQNVLDEETYIDQFVKTFRRAVKKCSTAKQPVGISLTGGLDTRMIISCLGREAVPFPCYTFGSMYRDTFDVKVARLLTQICGQNHQTIVLDQSFIKQLPYLLEKAVKISDGYIGLSGAAELYSNIEARTISPVRLTGNYGSELLRGMRAFKAKVPSGDFLRSEAVELLRTARVTFNKLEAIDQRTFALFKQAPLQGYGRLKTENSQVRMRTPFIDNDLVKLSYQAPLSLQAANRLSVAVIFQCNPELLKIPSDRGLLGTGSSCEMILRRLERELLFKAEYWTGRGMPMWLVPLSKTTVPRYLHKAFIGRHKFLHFQFWIQEYFADYVRETISRNIKGGLSDFFSPKRVLKVLDDHFAHKKNHLAEIDLLLTLCLAQQNILESRDD